MGPIEVLRNKGIEVVGEIETYDYGKFGWVIDPEGNKVELWEPKDATFRKTNKMDPI